MLQHSLCPGLSQARGVTSWVTISATVLALTGQELLGHLLLFGEHRASVHGEFPLESERESLLPQAGTQELFGAPLCPLPCSLAALILFWGGDPPFVGRLSSLLWDSCHPGDTQPCWHHRCCCRPSPFTPACTNSPLRHIISIMGDLFCCLWFCD